MYMQNEILNCDRLMKYLYFKMEVAHKLKKHVWLFGTQLILAGNYQISISNSLKNNDPFMLDDIFSG